MRYVSPKLPRYCLLSIHTPVVDTHTCCRYTHLYDTVSSSCYVCLQRLDFRSHCTPARLQRRDASTAAAAACCCWEQNGEADSPVKASTKRPGKARWTQVLIQRPCFGRQKGRCRRSVALAFQLLCSNRYTTWPDAAHGKYVVQRNCTRIMCCARQRTPTCMIQAVTSSKGAGRCRKQGAPPGGAVIHRQAIPRLQVHRPCKYPLLAPGRQRGWRFASSTGEERPFAI